MIIMKNSLNLKINACPICEDKSSKKIKKFTYIQKI